MTKEELTAKVVAAPAQAVPAPGVEAVSEREFKQFLSDVLTAAGLVTHGKKCKDLGRRLGEMSMRLLTAPRTAAAPSDAPHAELLKTWREGQRWQTRGDPEWEWLDTTPCWHADREYRRHPDDAAVTTALLAAERESLQCDYCGAVTDDPWHSSGMLHGQLSRHIHSCDICAAQAQAQAQARWQWLATYLVGPRDDMDDGIVACESLDLLTLLVDIAIAAEGAAQKGDAA